MFRVTRVERNPDVTIIGGDDCLEIIVQKVLNKVKERKEKEQRRLFIIILLYNSEGQRRGCRNSVRVT